MSFICFRVQSTQIYCIPQDQARIRFHHEHVLREQHAKALSQLKSELTALRHTYSAEVTAKEQTEQQLEVCLVTVV